MNVIYLCCYKTKSLRSNHVRVFLPRHQAPNMYILKSFRCIIANTYNILQYVNPLYYVICVICITKKLKYLKNEARNRKLTDNLLCYFKCSFK